ncbi:MAG: ABC transporter permease [Chloroflexi bacterium]|nr:ABC transporter permease [Chloroflexota bacterium]
MILKNLWRRKTRTLLTLLGIAVGVAAVVSLSAFGEGFASGFERIFSTSEADLTVGQKDAIMLMISSVDESVGDEIKTLPGVQAVNGVVFGMVQMPEAPYFIVMGEDLRGFSIQHYQLVAGEPITGRKQILIGKITAKNFRKEVGQTFLLNDVTYRVVGIYETGTSMEDGGAVMSLDDAQRTFDKRRQVNYFKVKVEDPRQTDQIKKAIESQWGNEVTVIRSGEATKQDEMFDLYRSFGWFLGVFALLVGGLGMMNTMLMNVFERTREIGVLRAVGWSKRRVIGMIMGESVSLSILGGVLGVLLGIGLTSLARLSPAVESLLSGVYTPTIFVQAIVVALLLGTLGGLYPAWRAAQLQPVEAMRAESGASVNSGWLMKVMAKFLAGGALRNLWRRPTRTLVTISGIGIGVGFIVALMAMSVGMESTFGKVTTAGDADLVAEQAKTADLSLSQIDERLADRLRGHPAVKSTSKVLFGIADAPGLPYFFLLGLDPSEDYIQHYRIKEGRMFERKSEIIIGRFAANSLKKGLGDVLRVSGTSLQIVGIYENGSVYEDAGGTISLDAAQELFNKPGKVSLINIQLKESDRPRVNELVKELGAAFPQLLIMRSTAFMESMQDFASMTVMINSLVMLTMIVGGIVMMNAMLMSVFERTQEIGVLRALGWRRRRIVGMIVVESLALGVFSTLAGIGIGVGLNYLFLLVPGMGIFLTPEYPPMMFAQVLALAVVLGVVGGLYPAWRAAGLRPVEALRYE